MGLNQALSYLSQINWFERVKDIVVGLPYYTILVFGLLLLLFPLGYFISRVVFTDKLNNYLHIGTGGFMALSIVTLLSNAVAYKIGTPAAFFISAVPFIVFDVLIVFSFRVRQVLKCISLKDVTTLLKISVPLVLLIFLAIYKLPNFDEEYHFPVIATILKGNFPILQPTNPFWLRQYDYHYGWQLIAAAISSFYKVSPYVGLDCVKLLSLLFGLSVYFGITKHFKISTKNAAVIIYSVLLIGPFWFFRDNFTRQYIFLTSVDMISFPIIQNLQAISHYSIFVFFLLVMLLHSVYENAFDKLGLKLLVNFVLLTIMLFLALTAEYYFMLLGLFFTSATALHLGYLFLYARDNFRIRLIRFILILFIFALALFVSIFQGGTFSGLLNPGLITDRQIPAIIDHFEHQSPNLSAQAIQNTSSLINRPLIAIRSLSDWGFIREDMKYITVFDVNNWSRIFPYLGLYEILIYPIFVILILFTVVVKRQKISFLVFLLLLIALSIPMIKIMFTTRFGDQNLIRGDMLYTSVFYAFSCWYVLTRLKHNIIIGSFWSLVILSSLPAVIFVFGVFIIKPTIGPYKVDRSLDSREAKSVVSWINDTNIRGRIVSLMPVSDSLTSSTGLITYRSFFEFYPNIYTRVVKDLYPEDFIIIGAKYLYADNDLLAGMTARGTENLAKYFTLLYRETTGTSSAALYSLAD